MRHRIFALVCDGDILIYADYVNTELDGIDRLFDLLRSAEQQSGFILHHITQHRST